MIEIFLQSNDVEEIRHFTSMGVVAGLDVTTSATGRHKDCLAGILGISDEIKLPIQIEILENLYGVMIAEAARLAETNPFVVIKVPMTPNGLKVCHFFRNKDIDVNVAYCASIEQCIASSLAGATYISFMIDQWPMRSDFNRLVPPVQSLRTVLELLDRQGSESCLMATGVRTGNDLGELCLASCPSVAAPAQILNEMLSNDTTDNILRSY